jgi:hypothetical protein
MNFKKEEWLFISGFVLSLSFAFWWFGDMLSPQESTLTYELSPNERARALARGILPAHSDLVRGREVATRVHQKPQKERYEHPLKSYFDSASALIIDGQSFWPAVNLYAYPESLVSGHDVIHLERGYLFVQNPIEHLEETPILFHHEAGRPVLLTGQIVIRLREGREIDLNAAPVSAEVHYQVEEAGLMVIQASNSSDTLELFDYLSAHEDMDRIELDMIDLPTRLR